MLPKTKNFFFSDKAARIEIKRLPNGELALTDGTDYRSTPLRDYKVYKNKEGMDYSLYRIHGVENIENIYISSVLSNSQYACICESIIFLK